MYTKVGEVGSAQVANGTEQGFSFDRYGNALVRDAFEQASLDGRVYCSSMQAAAALGTALTATAVTLTIWNPNGSGYKVIVHRFGVSVATAPAGAAHYVVVQSFSAAILHATNTAALITQNGVPTTSSIARAYTATTTPTTPTVIDTLGSILATGAVGPTDFYNKRPYVLAPGASITIQGLTTASNGICSAIWEEQVA